MNKILSIANKVFYYTLGISLLLGIAIFGFGIFEKSNRINLEIINKTELGISNITLIGRNALTKIVTLAPEAKKTIIFKGKRL